VGLFVLVPVIAIPAFLVYTLGKAELFQDWRHLHVVYETSYGLTPGDAVTVSDIRIGRVTEVDLTADGRAYVTFKVLMKHVHLIRKDSEAILRQKNILFGDWIIALTKGSLGSEPVEEQDTLTATPPMRLDVVIDQIRSMVATFESILRDVDEGKGFVGHLVKDDTLVTVVTGAIDDIARVARSANRAVREADNAFRKFGELGDAGIEVADSLDELIEKITPAVTEAQELFSSLDEAAGHLSPMFEQAQTDLEEIEVLLKGLQKHWLFRRSVEKQLEDEPEEELQER
jgi:ABC-type transporter Mla subunit MlaD